MSKPLKDIVKTNSELSKILELYTNGTSKISAVDNSNIPSPASNHYIENPVYPQLEQYKSTNSNLDTTGPSNLSVDSVNTSPTGKYTDIPDGQKPEHSFLDNTGESPNYVDSINTSPTGNHSNNPNNSLLDTTGPSTLANDSVLTTKDVHYESELDTSGNSSFGSNLYSSDNRIDYENGSKFIDLETGFAISDMSNIDLEGLSTLGANVYSNQTRYESTDSIYNNSTIQPPEHSNLDLSGESTIGSNVYDFNNQIDYTGGSFFIDSQLGSHFQANSNLDLDGDSTLGANTYNNADKYTNSEISIHNEDGTHPEDHTLLDLFGDSPLSDSSVQTSATGHHIPAPLLPDGDPDMESYMANSNLDLYGSSTLGNNLHDFANQSNGIVTDVTIDNQFRPHFTSNKVEFSVTSLAGLYSEMDFDTTDLRLRVHTGFDPSQYTVKVRGDGYLGTLMIVETATGLAIGADATISKFGPLTEKFQELGINTPVMNWANENIAAFNLLPTPRFLTYQDTVLELAGYSSQGIPGGFQYLPEEKDAQQIYAEAYRGNVFQVLGNNSYVSPIRYSDIDYAVSVNLTEMAQEQANSFGFGGLASDAMGLLNQAGVNTTVNAGTTGPVTGRMDEKMGYLPAGVGDEEFIRGQQILFGSDPQYPYHGFLDPVQNQMNIEWSQFPIHNFQWGKIKLKWPSFRINMDFKGPRLLADLADWLDRNINLRNPFSGFTDWVKGLKFPEIPWPDISLPDIDWPEWNFPVLNGIKDFFTENEILQKIGDGIGDFFKAIGGWAKKLKWPEWAKLPKINFPSLKMPDWVKNSASAVGSFVGNVATSVGGALNAVGGAIGDAAAYLAPDIDLSISGNLNPFEAFELPSFDLRNPINLLTTDYGGQAIFKNRAGLRNASTVPKPNGPADLTRNTAAIGGQYGHIATLADATQQPVVGNRKYEKPGQSTPYAELGKKKYSYGITDFYPNQSMNAKAGGDRMTIAPMLKGQNLTAAGYDKSGNTTFVESEKNGMPFYIKDLRDNTYIIFRGYITGLAESLSPSWSSEKYIGRSEPVYMYDGGEREVSFNLRLFAQTNVELTMIYDKLRKLTSLTYPEYKQDLGLVDPEQPVGTEDNPNSNLYVGKVRMKPPLMAFRIGELYGNNYKNQLGFIDSLSYTFPDESPWEFRGGHRVPKMIDASVTLKVLHVSPPNMNTVFYGFPHLG